MFLLVKDRIKFLSFSCLLLRLWMLMLRKTGLGLDCIRLMKVEGSSKVEVKESVRGLGISSLVSRRSSREYLKSSSGLALIGVSEDWSP